LRCPESIIHRLDFSTGASNASPSNWAAIPWPKSACRPTGDQGGVSELNLMQLEGQAVASVRAIAARLRELGRLAQLGRRRYLGHPPHLRRIDVDRGAGAAGHLLERSLAGEVYARGLERLGGPQRVQELIGAPGHPLQPEPLVKDEGRLPKADWKEPIASWRTGRSRPAT